MPHDQQLFKQLLTTYFTEFLDAFFPAALEHIDTTHLTFLEQEIFTDIVNQDKRVVDLLVETKIKGEDGLIIVYVEAQSAPEANFHQRMFHYFSRIYEKYQRRILPITIFSHRSTRSEPDSLQVTFPFFHVLPFTFSNSNSPTTTGGSLLKKIIRPLPHCSHKWGKMKKKR
ncbi:Rpn family recombination-promoting nuclease/putative transposase [Salsuginibacillus kocurii]|uniref:Rpn family recombination-promoting nuclease/putative transposase n=1 Tax=Salsuginibacillus kocurii TaxID=427078 RepID=UPI000A057A11